MDLSHFGRNAGLWGVVRLVGVAGLFTALGVDALVHDDEPWPLVAWAIALALPLMIRRVLVEHLDVSVPVLRWFGISLVASSVLYPLCEELLPAAVRDGPVFLATLFALAGFYLSSWFWLHADPQLIRTRPP